MGVVGVEGAAQPRAGTRLRLAGLAGMLMLPVFVLTTVTLTWLDWDALHDAGWIVVHGHDLSYPGELARGEHGVFQSMNFLGLAFFALIFSRGLRTQFVHTLSGRVAAVALGAVAVSGVLSAFVPDLPTEPASWPGQLHDVGLLLLFLGSTVAFVAAGLALRGAVGWRGYPVYSMLNALPALGLVAVFGPWDQVASALALGIGLSWFAVFGFHMRWLADG